MEDFTRDLLDSMIKLQKEIDRSFREILSKFSEIPEITFGVYEPPADIEDKGEEIIIYCDLPGFRKDEVKIKVTEDRIEIFAEKSKERKEIDRQRKYYRKERVYESFYKKIDLPVKVRPEQARASYNNGILEIHLPKSEATRELELSIE